MAKKEQAKEVERWITVNGARVPVFKDGSIGGPKALRDKIKENLGAQKKSVTPKTDKKHSKSESEGMKEAREIIDFQHSTKQDKQDYLDYLHRKGRITDSEYATLTGELKDSKPSAEDKRIAKQRSDWEKEHAKEKQISRNKKEADERNTEPAKLSSKETERVDKLDEAALTDRLTDRLAGKSGIDEDKAPEMAGGVINAVKAGTIDRATAKAYGLTDEEFDSLRKSVNNKPTKKEPQPITIKKDKASAEKSQTKIDKNEKAAKSLQSTFDNIKPSGNNDLQAMRNAEKVTDAMVSAPIGTMFCTVSDSRGQIGYEKIADTKYGSIYSKFATGLYAEGVSTGHLDRNISEDTVGTIILDKIDEGTKIKISFNRNRK